MSRDPRYYVWLDLETSGLDPRVHEILELGAVITTPDLFELSRFHRVIQPESVAWQQHMDEYVTEMHTGSGLLDELLDSPLTTRDVDRFFAEMFGAMGEPGDFVLAGSGVSHFDRRFLDSQMPELAAFFAYYTIDVGILRRTMRDIVGRSDLLLPEVPKPHRAMEDALLHLEEMRFLKKALDVQSQPA